MSLHSRGFIINLIMSIKNKKFIYLIQLDKNTIVDLSQPEELKGLTDLGADLVNTT